MEKDTNNMNGITGQPIDLVIPMVFPDDKEWLSCFARYHNGDAQQNVRFRSWGDEELLIKCCKKYMPWLNHIYILLARESQIQPWMNDCEGVSVVMHRDFIPQQYLPCFASPCIEMFLNRIPGLSEQFIYANDDMFPLSPLEPTDFFRNGKACIHIREKRFPEHPNIFQRKCLYQQNMVGKPFGKSYTRVWLYTGHSFAPILKSACDEVMRRHGKEIMKYISPLRRTDHSFNQYIYMLYEYFAGLTIDHMPHVQYAGEGTATDKLSDIIANPDAGIVCLNDNENIPDWQHRATIVRRAISSKLGIPFTEPVEPIQPVKPTDSTNALPTVCIVHYNTPKLTYYCIRSLMKHSEIGRIIIFDNSDRLPFMSKNKQFVADHSRLIEVIDNTHGQVIDFDKWLASFPDKEPSPGNNYGSAKHCYTVQWLVDNAGSPFILMDSDVLIRRDIAPFWQHKDCAWVGEIGENVRERFGYDIHKLQPFFCFINAPMMKQKGITYFNASYMWNLTTEKPNHRYDTGAWFLRAVSEANLPTHELRLSDYILHLAHASWRNRNPFDWLNRHKDLWI